MFLNPNRILPPEPVTGIVTLAPAYNVLTTMSLINTIEHTADLDDWIIRTVDQLDNDLLEQHHLVFWGFGLESLANAVDVDMATAEFPVYLNALKTADSEQLRDRIWQTMRHSTHVHLYMDAEPEFVPANILENKEQYIAFIDEMLKKFADADKPVPPQIYARAYDLLVDAAALQALLITHLTDMWENTLAAEWQRIRPLLEDCVAALQQIDLPHQPVFDLIQTVAKRDLRTIFKEEELLKFRQIQFIPSIHNGPYILWSGKGDILRLTFSAYIPETAATTTSRSASQLSQAELLNRLKALADKNRLQILEVLGQEGELSAQDMMNRFQLSKSAVSRHLRQLYANNLISERRVSDGVKKFYRLNPDSAKTILNALAQQLHVTINQ